MSPTNDSTEKDPLEHVNQTKLLPLVRQAIDLPSAETVVNWAAETINKGGSGSGLYQLKGTAQAGERTLRWSLFLKILRVNDRLVVSETEWKREALLYESGLLDEIPGGLRAVRCYGQEHVADNEIWLWLEDASEAEDIPWPLERHALAAYHLGQFNGSQLVAQALPTEAFLSHEFDRKYFIRDGHNIDPLLEVRGHPDIRRVYTEDVFEAIHWLWEGREEIFCHMYDHLPQCFGHLDTARVNLFAEQQPDGTEETIAIDWARSGIGPIGEDLRSMVTINLGGRIIGMEQAEKYNRAVFAEQATQYDSTIFASYIEGLAANGWQGDPQLARYGFAATAAVFYLLRSTGWLPGTITSKKQYLEKIWKMSSDDVLGHCNTLLRLAVGWTRELQRLGNKLF